MTHFCQLLNALEFILFFNYFSTDAYVEALDRSRVHPETYEWARKMAVDALDLDEDTNPATALEEILLAPERLKDLDLDAFARELNRQVRFPNQAHRFIYIIDQAI